ncbi:MAG: acyl-CoA dehydrogenase family protein, partial [Gammaproteobacteria bacterium]|nr:acyl-CoA dehydrogenase family protein [Gammaproteobacteria bacterium]
TSFTDTPLQRVHRLADAIREGGDEAQKVRHLPAETAAILTDEGFYRFTLPYELGGENASVRETIEVLEAMAAIDGSVAWNVMIGSEINAIAAGGMDPAIAKDVYLGNPKVIMCGGGGPGTQPSFAIKQKDGS